MADVAPIILNQYVAAGIYYGSVCGLVFLDSLPRILSFVEAKYRCRRGYSDKLTKHWLPTVWTHKLLSSTVPLPLFRSYHGADVIRYMVLFALNILFAIQTNQYTTDFTLYGWMTLANAGLALLFATRSNIFGYVFRLPRSLILQYHRWVGVWTFAYATTHMAYNINFDVATQAVGISFTAVRIQIGLMTWICLALIFLTALPPVRRRFFEVFYYSHFLFLLFLAGAYYHSTSGVYATDGIEYTIIGLGFWFIDRCIRFVYDFRPITVQDVTYYEGDLTKIHAVGMRRATPGQIVWLQVSQVSYLNWHPFTIASSTTTQQQDKSAVVTTLAIRGLGGYTSAVQQLAGSPKDQIRIRFDGPYGAGKFNWEAERLVVLIAGGIGITPGLAVASYVVHRAIDNAVPFEQQVHLLWTVKHASHIKWFAKEFEQLQELAARSTVTLRITIHYTSEIGDLKEGAAPVEEEGQVGDDVAAAAPWKLVHGRPNIRAWLQNIQDTQPGFDAAVNICGPTPLIRQARAACVRASSTNGLFHIEEEVFEM